MSIFEYLNPTWIFLTAAFDLLVALIASAHVVLTKRDTRAVVAWVGLIWLAPLIGSILYVWLGINRIKRRARQLRRGFQHVGPLVVRQACPTGILGEVLGPQGHHLCSLDTLVSAISGRDLLAGNHVEVLCDGDQAYPAMLSAIDNANQSIALSTYIFDADDVGLEFLAALKRALDREVEVRVVIDDMGARYSWTSMARMLHQAGIPCSTFIPPLIPWRFQHSNLRTHRKILITDGIVGFTGGMNIREGHWHNRKPAHPIHDVHFRVRGPVVSQMQSVFVDDWAFCTNEVLSGERWFPTLDSQGNMLVRGISDGPDEDFESFRHTLLGAIACADTSIQIVTPYFLPDAAIITALNVAALRGVVVDIVLPERNNILLVQWACTAMLWQLVERGCRIWFSPPPFDHAKLLVIDKMVSFVGSSNWDARSLRLNFEFNLECYSAILANQLSDLVEARILRARRINLQELDGRPLPIKLRDGIARLATPYL